MSEGNRINMYEEQPDVGGNRHYDYISTEELEVAEKTLEKKEAWSKLNSHEIVALRCLARNYHLEKDIVDHKDRLEVLRCLFWHCSNRDEWMKKEEQLRTANAELVEALKQIAEETGTPYASTANEALAKHGGLK